MERGLLDEGENKEKPSISPLDMGTNVTIGDGLMEIIGQGATFFVAWLAFVQISFLYGRRGMAYGT